MHKLLQCIGGVSRCVLTLCHALLSFAVYYNTYTRATASVDYTLSYNRVSRLFKKVVALGEVREILIAAAHRPQLCFIYVYALDLFGFEFVFGER